MRAAHLLACLILAGCAGSAPEPFPWSAEPVEYHPPPAVAEKAAIRDGRFPIDLPTVLRLAGAQNLYLAFVRESVQEAYAYTKIAEEQFWPTISPMYRFTRHEGLTQSTPGAIVDVDKQKTFVGVRAVLDWEIGRAIYDVLSAGQRYEGSKSRFEAAEEAVLLDAAETYYDLVMEHLRARVSEESAGVSEKLATELTAAVEVGRGFQGDVLRARVRHTGSRLAVLRARESIRLTSIRLASLLHLAPGIELYPVEAVPRPLELVPPETPDGDLIAEAMENRPELRAAKAELAASEHAESGATWAPLIPNLQIDAAPGRLDHTLSDLEESSDYVVTLGWKIGPGGLFDFGRSDLASSRVRQARIRLAQVRQRITDEVLASTTQLRARGEQRELAGQAVKDAEEALRLNQERQRRNIGLPLEVLEAEEALTRARLDYYRAVVEVNQAQLRAYAATGRRRARNR